MSENVHPRADELHSLTTRELVELMSTEEIRSLQSVHGQIDQIVTAIDQIAARLRSGGRLHYFGAGTSGRIAELDALECPATFGVAADVVQAHTVDGDQEDDLGLGKEIAARAGMAAGDVALGISASGETAFVLGALDEARARGAFLVAVACRSGSPLARRADIAIVVEPGAEVIAGSTRLKAGSVQKVILDMLSTGVFTRLGLTYRGRMVGLVATNDKMRARALRIVTDLAHSPEADAHHALETCRGNTKVAIVMLSRAVTPAEARRLLDAADGNLDAILAQVPRA